MKHLRWLLFVFLIASACNLFSSLPGDGGGSSASSTSPNNLQVPSEPVHVAVTLEAASQVETVITPQGGTLSATAASGAVYTLEIPAGALVADTTIRMTPVASLAGMPFGSEAYTVQFEPEGLQFYTAAILTVRPPAEIPLDQQIFFGYQAQGQNLALAAPVVNSPEIKIQVFHFSGYGVTKGLLADIEPVRQRLGGDAERRLQSVAAEQLTRERQRQLLGGEGDSDLDFSGLFKEFEAQVIKPRLAAAGESCAAGRLAIQTVLGYERQRQLLGVSDGSDSLFDAGLMETVADVCMKEEYEMCRNDHIIHRIIPAWLGLERQSQLLGVAEGSAVLEKARDYVRKCLTFELQFQSEGNMDDGGGGGYDSSVESKVKIQFDPAGLTMGGKAPLVNTAFEFKVPGCNVTSNRGGGEFEAISLAIISDTSSPTDQLGYVRDFKLIYFPGNTSESFTVACEDTPPFTSPASPLWTGMFLPLHQGEMSMSEGGFLAEGWEVTGGEYFAKKEWIKDEGGLGITEAGTFKLYHKPE